MILAETQRRRADPPVRAEEEAARRTKDQIGDTAILYGNLALAYSNLYLMEQAVEYCAR
jgi:hypothetical protein